MAAGRSLASAPRGRWQPGAAPHPTNCACSAHAHASSTRRVLYSPPRSPVHARRARAACHTQAHFFFPGPRTHGLERLQAGSWGRFLRVMQPGLSFEEAPPPTPPAKPAGNGRPFPLTVAELHEMQDAPPRGGGDALVAFRLLNDVIGKPGDRGEDAAGEALAVRCRATNPDELRTEIRAQWPLSLPSLAGGGQPLEGQGAAGDAGMRGGAHPWVHSTSAPLPLREDNVLDAKGSRPAPEVEEKPQMDTSLPASGVAWKELPRDAVLRDETTAAQEACIRERERRWGGQLPPEQVRARRHGGVHPAFFREFVVSATPEDARRASRRRAIEKELLHEARAADAEEQEWTIWPKWKQWPVPSRWPAHVLRKPDSGPRGRPFAHCGRGPTAAAVGVPRLRRTLRDCCSYDGCHEGPDKLQVLEGVTPDHDKAVREGRLPRHSFGVGRGFGRGAYVDRGRPFAREAAVPVAIDVVVKTRGVVARLAMGEGGKPWRPPSHPEQPTYYTIVHRRAHAHAYARAHAHNLLTT